MTARTRTRWRSRRPGGGWRGRRRRACPCAGASHAQRGARARTVRSSCPGGDVGGSGCRDSRNPRLRCGPSACRAARSPRLAGRTCRSARTPRLVGNGGRTRADGVCSMHSPLAVIVPAALMAACCAMGARRLRSSEREVRAVGPRPDTSCAIGIYEAENARNASMLLRSAFLLGADAVFTVCKKFKQKKSCWGPGDTLGASGQLNTMHCTDIDDMIASLPADAALVGVEKGGVPLRSFTHPLRAIYLLGSENAGLPPDVLARCQHVVELETVRGSCGGEGTSHTRARARTHTLCLPCLSLSLCLCRSLAHSLSPYATDTAGMFNVHVAGSLIMFHRAHQLGELRPVQSEVG